MFLFDFQTVCLWVSRNATKVVDIAIQGLADTTHAKQAEVRALFRTLLGIPIYITIFKPTHSEFQGRVTLVFHLSQSMRSIPVQATSNLRETGS